MAIKLKQSTAGQEIPLGHFVDSTDGDTAETALTIANTDIKLWKMGATTLANKNSGGATHIAGGIYYCTLDATDTNTLGAMVVFVHVSGALSVRVECEVLPANVYDSLIAGTDTLQADVTQIDGQATSGNNATLNLKQLNIVNSAGDAVVASATGSNGHGINASGNGSGSGMAATGGATGNGIKATAGATSGAGIQGNGSAGGGSGLQLSGAGTGHGIHTIGDGSGHGIYSTGGATGHGLATVGGATSGDGLYAAANGGGKGANFVGIGANAGLQTQGGATGNGVEASGGATAGAGIRANGSGISNGITAVGGATGNGIKAEGGATAGAGIRAEGTGSANGVTAIGGATGNGINAVGGATSGDGINATANGGGNGIDAVGIGANAGLRTAGGATGPGIHAHGGATSGPGCEFHGHGATANAFELEVDGSGATIVGLNNLAAQDVRDAMKLAPTAGTPGVGSVDEHLDDILIDTGASIPALIAALNDLSAAEVNAEMVDVLTVDTISELTAPPAATPTMVQAVMLVYMALRNKRDATATLDEIHNDAGTVIAKSTLSDDGTTFTRAKLAAGP